MKKTQRSKIIALLLTLFLVSIVLVGCGGKTTVEPGPKETAPKEKQIIKLTVGSANTTTAVSWTRKLDEFFVAEVSKRVAEKTNYTIEWTKVYGGAVAKVGEELQSVQNRLVDLSMVVYPYEASKLPLQNFTYWIPFGSPDPLMSAKVMKQMYKEFPALSEPLEKTYKQKQLMFGITQNYHIVTNFPLTKVEDMKGHKIGAVGPNLHFLKGSGAVPVQTSIPELYTSLQTKVYDGMILYVDSLLNNKIYEVAPYITKVSFGPTALGVLTVNLDTYNSLPKEIQDIFVQVGNEFTDVLAKYSNETEQAQLEEWQKKGGKVAEFSQSERAKWAAMLPNNPDEKAKELEAKGLPAKDIVNRYIQLFKENGYTHPRDFKLE